MNKTIKKILALGTGSIMLGLTFAAAAHAATLADYPAPFVTNGVFTGKIVLGEKAQTIDTIGAIDIGASLQRVASVPVSTGTGGSTATTADGYKFSESTELIYGSDLNAVNSAVDDTDLPELLASGTVEGDDGTEYDYDVEIQLPAGTANVVEADVQLNDLDDKYDAPVVYFDLGSGSGATAVFYKLEIDFDDAWSLNEDSADDTGINEGSTTIELFGRSYTFDPNDKFDDSYMTLYGTDTTLLVAKGETQTITYNGKEYTVEVLGGNSDDSSAILRIGSDTRTVVEGDSKTIGGLPIYVKDVFVSNIGGDDVKVSLFLGSNKLEIEFDAADGEVKLNGNVLDEVSVAVTKSGTDNWEDVDTLTFTVTPSAADDEVEYILPGGDYVDPLFGSFKFHFVGADDLMENKEALKFERVGKKFNIEFTPKGASSPTTLTLLDDNGFHDDLFTTATLIGLAKNDIFIYNKDNGDADKAVTHLLQVTRVKDGNDMDSADFEVQIKDLSFGKTYSVTKCKALDSGIDLYPEEGTTENLFNLTTDSDCEGTDAANLPQIYTKAGALVEFYKNTTTEITSAAEIPTGTGYVFVTEDAQDDDDTAVGGDFLVKYAWDATDSEYDVSLQDQGDLDGALDDDENVDHYLSDFGTYVLEETDDSGQYVRAYIPAEEVLYDMFLLPVDSSVTVTKSSTGAVSINAIAVGMAIQDKDATLGSKPYIVVGGPCVNTVAAELMGSPEDCVAGFAEGKAMIKLYSEKSALLVAGYSGKDTEGAARVLSNYKDFGFSGTELEVVTTNLASLSVKKVG